MVEIGVRVRLFGEGEVPPFLGNWFEPAAHHGLAQQHPVAELNGIDPFAGLGGSAGERAVN